jgi:hypothetical protein
VEFRVITSLRPLAIHVWYPNTLHIFQLKSFSYHTNNTRDKKKKWGLQFFSWYEGVGGGWVSVGEVTKLYLFFLTKAYTYLPPSPPFKKEREGDQAAVIFLFPLAIYM